MFPLFDMVMILSQGETVYFGPGSELIERFSKLGYPCPLYMNPLDFAIDTATVDFRCGRVHVFSCSRVPPSVL